MSKDPQHSKEIDDYLSGDLSPEHRNEFEKKLKENNSLQEELNITKRVDEAIYGYAFKKMLKELHAKHFGDEKLED